DLRGAFIEAEEAGVAVEALDRRFRHVTGAAEDLDGAVGDSADHLAGEVFAAGGDDAGVLASVALARRIEDHAPRGVGFGPAVGEHRLDQLELADRPAELAPLAGVADSLGDEPLGEPDADRRDVEAPAVEDPHRRPEPLSFAPAHELF